MIIMGLKLDNILSFDDFEIDFSYKNKLRTSFVENEVLKNAPSFRYKKLNIIYGSNASGKTSLIMVIWKTLLFLDTKEKAKILDLVNDKGKQGKINIDLVTKKDPTYILHRFKIRIDADERVTISHTQKSLSTAPSSKESYETMSKYLDKAIDNFEDYLKVLTDLDLDFGWNVVLPATENSFNDVHFMSKNDIVDINEYIRILRSTLQTLDPSVVDIEESKDADDAYVITHEKAGKIILQHGMPISSIPRLSSGTKYGINIANMIYSIKYHRNGIYFVDEQFSYVNSDIEISTLATMVSLLGDDEQLFFTTHNENVMSLRFPFHSYYFLRKTHDGESKKIYVSCGSDVENRNNVSPSSIVENDLFLTAPDVNKIFEIGE